MKQSDTKAAAGSDKNGGSRSGRSACWAGWNTLTVLPPRRLWVIGATVTGRVMPMNLQDDGIWQLSNGDDCAECVTHWCLYPLHPSKPNIGISNTDITSEADRK
jgi:hypothetical protein